MTKGQRIRNRRAELSLSQTELANSIGVSKQTLYKYENDIVTNIPSDNIEKLSKALSVSPAWIMGFADPTATSSAAPTSFSQEETAIALAYRKADDGTKNSVAKLLDVKRACSDFGSVENNVG